MVINKILKQLTPERVKKEVEAIQRVKLPPELQKWVKEYEKVGERNEFIWKWAYEVAQVITFSKIPSKYRRSLIGIKFLMIMFIVLLDDVSDKMKNKRLLNEILKVPFEKDHIKLQYINNKEKRYLKFTIKLWRFIEKTFRIYPYYLKFKPIINYDISQMLNGIKYAYLVNKNLYLTNEIEFQTYLSHNTPAIMGFMIDLTCVPKFNIKLLGLMRKIMWYIQVMARISNWVATWKREVKENDFASGIFCYTIENKIIGARDIKKQKKEEIVKKINQSKAEKYLLEKWENFYNEIKKFIKKEKTFNGKKIIKITEKLTILHLISRGFI
ncbi:MAG: hypothetical protein ABIF12_03910 [bacterium]